MKKKISAAILVVIMLGLAVFISGCGKASQGLEFSSNGDGTCTWTGLGTCTDTEITVPGKVNGETVTEVGARVLDGDLEVTKVILPDSVHTIGEKAFYNTDIAQIDLGKGVKTIEKSAFYDCESLKSIEFPETLEEIGEDAFSACEGLTDVEFPEGLESIGRWAFTWCVGITEVILPEGLTELGEYAFSECPNVKKIHIPSTVNELAFDVPNDVDIFISGYGAQFDTTNLEEFSYAGEWTAFDITVEVDENSDTFKPYYTGCLVRDVDETEYPDSYTELTEENTNSVICALLNRQTMKVNGEEISMAEERPMGEYHADGRWGLVRGRFEEDDMLTVVYEGIDETDVATEEYSYDEETNTYAFTGSGTYDGQDIDIEKYFVFFGDFLYCYDIITMDGKTEEYALFWTIDD